MGIPSYKFQELCCSTASDVSNYHMDSFSSNIYTRNATYSYANPTLYLRHKINMFIIAMLILAIKRIKLIIFVCLMSSESGEKVSPAIEIIISNILYLVQIQNASWNFQINTLFLYFILKSIITDKWYCSPWFGDYSIVVCKSYIRR